MVAVLTIIIIHINEFDSVTYFHGNHISIKDIQIIIIIYQQNK